MAENQEEKKGAVKAPRKTSSRAKPKAKEEEVKAEEEVKEEEAKKPAKKAEAAPKEEKRKIDKDTEVWVYNNTNGKLLYEARKGNGFLSFERFMDSDTMTVEELQQMRNTHRRVLEDGWLFIDDEEVLDYLRLGDIKDKVMSPNSLEELLNKPTDFIKERIDNLTRTSKVTLYSLLREKYRKGEFGNVHTIKAIEKALNVSDTDSLLRE